MPDPDKLPVKPGEAPKSAPSDSKEPVSPEVKAIAGQAQKMRLEMAKDFGLPVSPEPQKPESPEKEDADAKPDASKPAAPEEKAKAADEKKRAQDFRDFVIKSRAEARSASLGELIGKLMQSISKLGGAMTGLFDKMTGTAKKATEQAQNGAEAKSEPEKLSEPVNPPADKSAEYAAKETGLAPAENPQILLDSLKVSGKVLVEDPGKMQDLQPGDMLFFKRNNEKGEPYAYLTAVVSGVDPLKMKFVPAEGGPPQEVTVKESDLFKNNWFGFVKMGKSMQAPSPAQTPAQPAPDTSPQV